MSTPTIINSELKNIARNFDIKDKIVDITPLEGGLINSTYKVKMEDGLEDYILQKKNSNIFKDVPSMMNNIVKVTSYLKKKVTQEGGDPLREVMTVIPTRKGNPYYRTENNEFWTMSLFIPDTIQFDSPDSPDTAFKGGEGIGKFHMQMADFTDDLVETLPGFHNLGYRLNQWDASLAADLASRAHEVSEEIKWVQKRRPLMEDFWKLIENGLLPKRVVHNDTKISNILFNRNKEVECVIDLDTVMKNTPLSDFGDAIRTFANTGKEDETDLNKVGLNLDIFKAYSHGYLSKMKNILSDLEKEYLVFGALYITYEQIVRFLMDYLEGDKYYKILYPDHNLVRTRAQMKLYENMEENYDKMNQIVMSLI